MDPTSDLASPSPSQILRAVLDLYRIRLADVIGPRRLPEFVRARRTAALALRDAGLGYSEIGRLLHRHYTDVMYLCGAAKVAK